jgi:class 3 adenylate cyclase
VIFPLRLKLALFTSALLVAGIGIVSALMVDLSRSALEEEARKRGESLVKNLSRNARDPVLLEDDVVIAKLLETVSAEAEVIAARVIDPEGRPIASSREEGIATYDRLVEQDGTRSRVAHGRLIVASGMTFQEVDLGEVQIVLDLDALTAPVIARARRDLLLVSGGLLGVGLLIAFGASTSLTRPLRRLRTAVRALASGDLAARVAPTTRDEVGDLARAFNEMGESLTQKRRIETAFRRYVSDHVLKEVLDKPDAISLRGEMREITVLFIDIRRFSRLAEQIVPELLVAFLNESFELITNRLLDHGGTVDKYIGDAILAYFGAPIESPDHPQRAVAAAIAIQRGVRERNLKRETLGQPFIRLDIGIAIHTGSVVVGNIGSELKMDYTAIGEPVNVTNRLQKLAEPGWILVTDEVAERISDVVNLAGLGARTIEGREEPINVHRVEYT